ncbi:mannose-1-phosphate guanylyltransferase [Balneola sp. MJW-20]|uniref:mannose-1-phosphate guanylyltransferase n=1 Tax=Gracilimonas aurantiaca TaxID=3234185 RepID=UPI003465B6B6
MTYAVIMAGGSGTRFWPKSTKELPKQFLKLFGEKTMLQNTVDRIKEEIPLERVLVVTNDRYVDIVKDQLPGIPAHNVVGEPVAKNTAPCVAIAAELLHKKDEEAVMVVLPADHHITKPDKFRDILRSAISKAKQDNFLVTIGIKPDRPETGYGYIHGNDKISEELEDHIVHPVRSFKEKPDLETARDFLKSGDYFWNSGMFVWSASTILNEVSSYLPDMFKLVKEAGESLYGEGHDAAVDHFYNSCESISIDYGIMENSKDVFVVPGEFGWNDVGSWTAVYDLGEKDQQGNVVNGSFFTQSAAGNNYISSESGKMISLVGVEGLAVVETENAILVCKLDQAQKVKDIVNQLNESEELKKFL